MECWTRRKGMTEGPKLGTEEEMSHEIKIDALYVVISLPTVQYVTRSYSKYVFRCEKDFRDSMIESQILAGRCTRAWKEAVQQLPHQNLRKHVYPSTTMHQLIKI